MLALRGILPTINSSMGSLVLALVLLGVYMLIVQQRRRRLQEERRIRRMRFREYIATAEEALEAEVCGKIAAISAFVSSNVQRDV